VECQQCGKPLPWIEPAYMQTRVQVYCPDCGHYFEMNATPINHYFCSSTCHQTWLDAQTATTEGAE
jgi:endogenous inhibitor of DNA gyrase (YacG/DUF329 family)